jgi:hypothetical protein
VKQLLEKHPDVQIFLADLDEEMSPEGMIIPGIGDAGDRQFGTPFEEGGDEVGGKRPRSESFESR